MQDTKLVVQKVTYRYESIIYLLPQVDMIDVSDQGAEMERGEWRYNSKARGKSSMGNAQHR